MQEAAKDLVNAEDEVREGEGASVLIDEDLPGTGEDAGAALAPAEWAGGDVGTTVNGDEHGDARTEEGGGGRREEEAGEALIGEGGRCLRLGLKAEGPEMGSVSAEGLEGGRCCAGRLKVGVGLLRDPGSCWSVSLGWTEKHIKMSTDLCLNQTHFLASEHNSVAKRSFAKNFC